MNRVRADGKPSVRLSIIKNGNASGRLRQQIEEAAAPYYYPPYGYPPPYYPYSYPPPTDILGIQ